MALYRTSETGKAKNKASQQRQNAKHKKSRESGAEPEKWILYYSRKADKQSGLGNDLTKEFVAAQIHKGCSYCGATEHMTLDRIDNARGHVQGNVVPACFRCNTIRGPMPYEAWLEVVSNGLKSAIDKGLLGNWGLTWKAR